MSEGITRCPYCVFGGEFRPMYRRSKKRFVCLVCGHTTPADESYHRCHCSKCERMNLLALRCRSEEDSRRPLEANFRGRA
jgi:hypothetical protein